MTGGTRNVLAEIDVDVTAGGAPSGTLARLAALLERAQPSGRSVQRLADRVAGVFAPAVLAITAAHGARLDPGAARRRSTSR